MKFEQDEIEIIGGLRHGRTLGSPVAIRIGNTEWPKWEKVMAADPVDPVCPRWPIDSARGASTGRGRNPSSATAGYFRLLDGQMLGAMKSWLWETWLPKTRKPPPVTPLAH